MKTIFKKGANALKSGYGWISRNPKVFAMIAVFMVFGVSVAFGQDTGKGAAAFGMATEEIKTYKTPVQNLMYAIAAVIALVGAFNVYHKMTNGDQDVKKTIMLTLGGCIAMVALSTALPAFFGM